MNNKIKKTIIGTAVTAVLGGTVYLGSEVGKPECDYVIIKQNQEEICLTVEQMEAITEQVKITPEGTGGFGGIKFGKKELDIIKK